MRKRALLLAILSCASALTAVYRFQPHYREPIIDGKPLGYWVDSVPARKETDDVADDAVLRAGTNALPFLLEWIQYETPPWRYKSAEFIEKILPPPIAVPLVERLLSPPRGTQGAARAFLVLGAAAAPAIPQLVLVATKKGASRVVVANAIFALGNIGTDAVPPMLDIIRNQHHANRDLAVNGIITVKGARPSEITPTLESALQDPDEQVRLEATNALSRIEPVNSPAQ